MRTFILKYVFVSACFLCVYGCAPRELLEDISVLRITPLNGPALDGYSYNQANDKMASGMIFTYKVQPIDQLGEDINTPNIKVCMYLNRVDDYYGYGSYNPGIIWNDIAPIGQPYGRFGFFGDSIELPTGGYKTGTDADGAAYFYLCLGEPALIDSNGGYQPYNPGWLFKPGGYLDVMDTAAEVEVKIWRAPVHGGPVSQYAWGNFFQGQYMGMFSTSPSCSTTSFSGEGHLPGGLMEGFPNFAASNSEIKPLTSLNSKISFKTSGLKGIPKIKTLPTFIQKNKIASLPIEGTSYTYIIDWDSWGKVWEDANGVWWQAYPPGQGMTVYPAEEVNDVLVALANAHAASITFNEPICVDTNSYISPSTFVLEVVSDSNIVFSKTPISYYLTEVSGDNKTQIWISENIVWIDNPDFAGRYEDRIAVYCPPGNYFPAVTLPDSNLFGDFDFNNDVNIIDLELLASHWLDSVPDCNYAGPTYYDLMYDADQNGKINFYDFAVFAEHCTGLDIIRPDIVNFLDFAVFGRSWMKSDGQEGYNQICDFYHDGIINYKDLEFLCANWLQLTSWSLNGH